MHTEIMCTLTPRQITEEPELVTGMHNAGMRSVRINTAHLQGVAQLDSMARGLKALAPDLRILIDTKGPEMRTTDILDTESITLGEGQEVCIEGTDHNQHCTPSVIHVNYLRIHRDVRPGDEMLADDGKIALRVTAIEGTVIHAVVTRGGNLGARKGVAVTGVELPLPAVSEHDRQYIAYASTSPYIDLVAHSFVRDAHDVECVREVMDANTKPIIAKIESQRGIDNIHRIISVADGILIARGDLTASIGKAAVPRAQAELAHATKSAGLPLYLATNILPSMMTSAPGGAPSPVHISSPTPSAADLAGIHLAVSQRVDVMLLTNETAAGAHPLASVTALHDAISSVS